MGFQVTTVTAIPLNGDGTFDQATWGESGPAFSVPADQAAGFGPNVLVENDLNYNQQHVSRHIRGQEGRTVFSDEGLFTSCIVSEGTFNTAGGTLDVTLTRTRVVVDVDVNGGVVLEITAPAGDPETLGALMDTYLNLSEAGGTELQAVPNDDPAPAPSAGFINVWKLVTDATELTAASRAEGVAPIPCLANVGALSIEVVNTMTTKDAVVTENLTLGDSGALLPSTVGGVRFNGTFWSIRGPIGFHTVTEEKRGWSTGFTVSAGEADTTTIVQRRVKPAEQVWFDLSFRFKNTVTGTAIIIVKINYTSAAGNGSILNTTLGVDVASSAYTAKIPIDWAPANDAIATEEDFTFTVRLGNGSGDLDADFIGLTVASNFSF